MTKYCPLLSMGKESLVYCIGTLCAAGHTQNNPREKTIDTICSHFDSKVIIEEQ